MVKLLVTTISGDEKPIDVPAGGSLMDALRDQGFVEGTCGGAASCGTCHVYFANPAKAGGQTEDEGYMLEGLAEYVQIRDGSRLSCQVPLTDALDGLAIEIAPEA